MLERSCSIALQKINTKARLIQLELLSLFKIAYLTSICSSSSFPIQSTIPAANASSQISSLILQKNTHKIHTKYTNLKTPISHNHSKHSPTSGLFPPRIHRRCTPPSCGPCRYRRHMRLRTTQMLQQAFHKPHDLLSRLVSPRQVLHHPC